jgi:superfamily II DNA helicase RecQ
LWLHAHTDKSINIHLLGPEQLISKGFKDALQTNYWNHMCAYGIDELHLMNTWGAGFRKVYQQIGFLWKRLTDCSTLIGVSATGRAGAPMESICHFLGLQPGSFHLIRRSNIRNDVQILFRELQSGVNGFTFPELDWVLAEGRITLIFTTTINMTFRLFAYLYRMVPPGNRRTRIRMYHSLNWKTFNDETRALMNPEQGSRRCQIVIATASLSVGIDIPGFDDVLVVGEVPRDADDFVQKVGRVRPRKDAG